MQRLAVVVLDLRKDRRYAEMHRLLNFHEQLARLEAHIKNACESLKEKEPTAPWIVTWREHGVFGFPYVSQIEKQIYKQRLAALTQQYPQLTIIAGTIKYARIYYFSGAESERNKRHQQINAKRKFSEIAQGYRSLSWMGPREWHIDQRNQFNEHIEHFTANQISERSVLKTVVRNVSYVFQKGECVARHDKTAPWDEVSDCGRPRYNTIFQCGKDRNLSSYVELDINGQALPIGIEICREHCFGVLKRECLIGNKSKPILHFVLSDSIDLRAIELHGHFVVHADSKAEPGLYGVGNPDDTAVNPVLYTSNLHSEMPVLKMVGQPTPISRYLTQEGRNMPMCCD